MQRSGAGSKWRPQKPRELALGEIVKGPAQLVDAFDPGRIGPDSF
jgi:hypothetical protein